MNVDTAIIGAGTAGLSALREVRRATEDFVLINDGHWGTTCAAVGCMPSKALIEAANAFHRRHVFDELGIHGGDRLRADIPAVLARVRRLRDGFVKGPASTPEKLGDRAIPGRARLLGPDTLEVNGRTIRARRIILATGSRPVVPRPWQPFGPRLLTTDTLFEQPDLPARMAVIGMGAIGVEMAQALARLGITTAGFDRGDDVAGIHDPEVLAAFRPLLGAELELHLGAPADITASGNSLRVTGAGGSFEADSVLVAMGRRPNLEGLGLESLGVALDDRGMPAVDPTTLRIGDLPVFLAGDANGERAILHEAADEGHIAGRIATGDGKSYCRRTPLAIVFSSPQVARVGATGPALDVASTVSGTVDFSRQGRARVAGTAAGILKVHAHRETGRILGAELCAPAGEHLAHLLALAVSRNLTVGEMLAMPFYHPVIEEGLRTALRDLQRQLPDYGASDLSWCPEVGHEALD